MKKIYKQLLFALFTLGMFLPVLSFAKDLNTVPIYFFWANGCPHCAQEEIFLEEYKKEKNNIKVYNFEVTGSKANQQLFIEATKQLGVDSSGIPLTIIGDYVISGYGNPTADEIKYVSEYCEQYTCKDVVGKILGIDQNIPENNQIPSTTSLEKKIPDKIEVPLLGEIKTKNLSLPILTIVIGALDGFNPCAMWTLVFLISMLLGMKNKKRMWALGMAFIVTSAFVYFVFMAAWLNLFLFIGFVLWVRIIIAAVALGAAYYNLKDYFINQNMTCKVTGTKKRQKVFEKIKHVIQTKQFIFALIGIIALAFIVNLVELVCSAGLPAVYTQVLTLSNLNTWQYYGYLTLYILIFMLDDLVVFFVAMITLQMTGISSKYSRISRLVGGIIMLILGILLIFKPEWLMFG